MNWVDATSARQASTQVTNTGQGAVSVMRAALPVSSSRRIWLATVFIRLYGRRGGERVPDSDQSPRTCSRSRRDAAPARCRFFHQSLIPSTRRRYVRSAPSSGSGRGLSLAGQKSFLYAQRACNAAGRYRLRRAVARRVWRRPRSLFPDSRRRSAPHEPHKSGRWLAHEEEKQLERAEQQDNHQRGRLPRRSIGRWTAAERHRIARIATSANIAGVDRNLQRKVREAGDGVQREAGIFSADICLAAKRSCRTAARRCRKPTQLAIPRIARLCLHLVDRIDHAPVHEPEVGQSGYRHP